MARAAGLIAFVLAATCLAQAPPELEIRVIYDNTSARADVKEDWGFSALVTFRGRRVLFDSGTKPELFLENLKKLDVEPQSIEQTLISHTHDDHRGGVYKLYPLHPRMRVHFLDLFTREAFEDAARIGMKPQRVTRPFELLPGMYSTGVVAGDPPEQSLVIETSRGIVMLVGCSHPGVVRMVEAAERQRKKNSVRLLLGGFHMFRQRPEQIAPQIVRLKELGVERIMPAHCTGDLAKQMIRDAFGAGYETAGAGKVVTLP
jgi:7,8-dihydropterin-6-yl-methyl-4-(beta-D-ribofuranosyl)aminobenzene 5'-phosphate synthase